jgi:hypothetical protein
LGKITICQILNITDVFKVFCVCLNKEGTDVIWTGSGSMNEKYPGRNEKCPGRIEKYPRQGNEIPQAME